MFHRDAHTLPQSNKSYSDITSAASEENGRIFEAIVDSSFADTFAVAGLFPTNHKEPIWGIVVVWMGLDRADPDLLPSPCVKGRGARSRDSLARRHVFWLIVPLSASERGAGGEGKSLFPCRLLPQSRPAGPGEGSSNMLTTIGVTLSRCCLWAPRL